MEEEQIARTSGMSATFLQNARERWMNATQENRERWLSKIPKLLTPADSSVTNVGTMFLASHSEVIAKEESPTLPGLSV